jgi:hypothetical protein
MIEVSKKVFFFVNKKEAKKTLIFRWPFHYPAPRVSPSP